MSLDENYYRGTKESSEGKDGNADLFILNDRPMLLQKEDRKVERGGNGND